MSGSSWAAFAIMHHRHTPVLCWNNDTHGTKVKSKTQVYHRINQDYLADTSCYFSVTAHRKPTHSMGLSSRVN